VQHARYVFNAGGDLLWNYQTGGDVIVSLSGDGEKLVAGSDDGFVYCFLTTKIIPEFKSFLILPLFMIATLLAVIVCVNKRIGIRRARCASLDNNSPTAVTAKYSDSPSIKFGGGNPWKEIGIWTASASLTRARVFRKWLKMVLIP
jgi:hypothetical protein